LPPRPRRKELSAPTLFPTMSYVTVFVTGAIPDTEINLPANSSVGEAEESIRRFYGLRYGGIFQRPIKLIHTDHLTSVVTGEYVFRGGERITPLLVTTASFSLW
jgi:hypothetical protein